MTKQTQKAIVRIERFNPDVDEKPYYQEFTVEVTEEKTLLNALQEIKNEQDGSLTFRKSCRHAICGSCAMNINGLNTLVCNKPLKKSLDKHGRVTIKALSALPVVKDLVVDRTDFWRQYMAVKPWLIPSEMQADKEYRMSQEEVEALHEAETCIMCGSCYSACPIISVNKNYMGPHALLKAYQRVMDPRDGGMAERLDIVENGREGIYTCRTATDCIPACPKGLNPARAISTLRNMAMRRMEFEHARQERQKAGE